MLAHHLRAAEKDAVLPRRAIVSRQGLHLLLIERIICLRPVGTAFAKVVVCSFIPVFTNGLAMMLLTRREKSNFWASLLGPDDLLCILCVWLKVSPVVVETPTLGPFMIELA